MLAEILAIGDEVLSGFTVNTNAAYISRQLEQLGITVHRHIVLPDEKDLLERGFKNAFDHADIVICTGGLGPTCDDITREIAAKIFDSDFVYDETIATALYKRYGDTLTTLKDQATRPKKAKAFINQVGTAPALVFEEKQKFFILLPGVPIEMRAFMETDIIPYLESHLPKTDRAFRKILYFCQMPEPVIDKEIRQLELQYPEINFGIYSDQGTVQVHLVTKADHASTQAQILLNQVADKLINLFPFQAFPANHGHIEEAVHHYLIDKQKTLALAESCTGGALASRLTQLPDASTYFMGSIISYSNQVKQSLLGVSEKTLKTYGAVSKQTAEEMVKGLLKSIDADYGISVTGIAGPKGGSPDKPVGTVWAAIMEKRKPPKSWTFHAKGNREMIIKRTCNQILSQFWRIVHNDPSLDF